MSEVKAQTDFLSIFYSFLNSATTFGSSMKDYEEKYKGRQPGEVFMDIVKNHPGNNVLTQQGNVVDYIIDTIVPDQYRILARGVKKLPLPQFLNIASTILKKYGEDGNGGYKTAEEVIEDVFKEQVKRRFFQR